MKEIGRVTVWTNGNCVRKYTGQDKAQQKHTGYWRHLAGEYFKATAILLVEDKEEKDVSEV